MRQALAILDEYRDYYIYPPPLSMHRFRGLFIRSLAYVGKENDFMG